MSAISAIPPSASSTTSFFFDGLYSSCITTFHLFYIISLGILAKKLNLIDKPFQRSLSKVVTNIALPCFIFSQILRSFHISQFMLIIEVMIGCSLSYFFGYFIGYFTMKLLGYTENQSRFVGSVFSSPNAISYPLILITTIGHVLDKIMPMPESLPIIAERRGYLYIIIGSIFSNIWRWSGGYYLIEPEPDPDAKYVPPPPMTICRFIKQVMNMPVIASLGSIILTCIPPVQNFLATPGTTVYNALIEANLKVGKAYSFLVMILLGLSLADSITFHPTEEVKKKIIFKGWDLFWICLSKLILMPIISAPFVIYVFKYLIHTDEVMLFLFLFMCAVPSGINMIVVCNLKNAYSESVSLLMVFMYGLSMITVTIGVTSLIFLLEYLDNVYV